MLQLGNTHAPALSLAELTEELEGPATEQVRRHHLAEREVVGAFHAANHAPVHLQQAREISSMDLDELLHVLDRVGSRDGSSVRFMHDLYDLFFGQEAALGFAQGHEVIDDVPPQRLHRLARLGQELLVSHCITRVRCLRPLCSSFAGSTGRADVAIDVVIADQLRGRILQRRGCTRTGLVRHYLRLLLRSFLVRCRFLVHTLLWCHALGHARFQFLAENTAHDYGHAQQADNDQQYDHEHISGTVGYRHHDVYLPGGAVTLHKRGRRDGRHLDVQPTGFETLGKRAVGCCIHDCLRHLVLVGLRHLHLELYLEQCPGPARTHRRDLCDDNICDIHLDTVGNRLLENLSFIPHELGFCYTLHLRRGLEENRVLRRVSRRFADVVAARLRRRLVEGWVAHEPGFYGAFVRTAILAYCIAVVAGLSGTSHTITAGERLDSHNRFVCRHDSAAQELPVSRRALALHLFQHDVKLNLLAALGVESLDTDGACRRTSAQRGFECCVESSGRVVFVSLGSVFLQPVLELESTSHPGGARERDLSDSACLDRDLPCQRYRGWFVVVSHCYSHLASVREHGRPSERSHQFELKPFWSPVVVDSSVVDNMDFQRLVHLARTKGHEPARLRHVSRRSYRALYLPFDADQIRAALVARRPIAFAHQL